jgi:hypothetical protein
MNRYQNTKNIAAITAAFVLSAVCCFAQEKQVPPAGGPPKPFTVPAHETYSLPNGMKVTLVPYGNLPKVSLVLVVRTGNLNEPADMPGLADLAGKLMKEPLRKVPANRGGVTHRAEPSTFPSASMRATWTPICSANSARKPRHCWPTSRNILSESELPRLKNDAAATVNLKIRSANMALSVTGKFCTVIIPVDGFPTQRHQRDQRRGRQEILRRQFRRGARPHLRRSRFDSAEMKKAIPTARFSRAAPRRLTSRR